MKLLTIIFVLYLPHLAISSDQLQSKKQWFENSFLTDAKKTVFLMKDASYLQFTQPPSWVGLGVAGATLWPTFNVDKKISKRYINKGTHGFIKTFGGGVSNIFNFPVVSATTYFLSKNIKNKKLYDFSIEYTATLYLTLMEAAAMSMIPVHERPVGNKDLTFWERAFRFESSFPSGHMAGFATLTFKTFQFYGPWWSLLPAGATYITALERVRSGKHYPSDVLATIFMSFLSSEGVRIAYKNSKHYHPWYKKIVDHNITLKFFKQKKNYYAGLSLSY